MQKFRPYNFKSDSRKNKFSSPLEFLEAIQMLLSHNKSTKDKYKNWLKDVQEAHYEKYGKYVE